MPKKFTFNIDVLVTTKKIYNLFQENIRRFCIILTFTT